LSTQPEPLHSGALWALILGILSVTTCSIFTGVPAIILGICSRTDLKTLGQSRGDGMALAGIILGAASFLILAVQIMLLVGLHSWIVSWDYWKGG